MDSAFRPDLFVGKTAFVAGGTSGINLAIAERLARAGAAVCVCSRSNDKVAAAVARLSSTGAVAIGICADVRDYAAVDQALARSRDQLGELHFVVSGAAGNFIAPALGMSANGFRTVVDIDLLGTFNVFRASFPYLRRPGASLIAISAGQAINPMVFQAHVCAAKAGVNMLTQCLAMEWGPLGVRVNAISPGPISGTEGMARITPTLESERKLKNRIPLRDYGDVADIAEAAMFLCSDSARYVTGSVLDCDGGSQLGDASADASVSPSTH